MADNSEAFTPARRNASETTGTMFCSWARDHSSLRHHPSEILVNLLRSNHIGQEHTIPQDGRRSVVAGRFYAQNEVCHKAGIIKACKDTKLLLIL